MAPSSVRDLVVKDDDLVAGTHGRGIWILDDITPLRQIADGMAARDAVLFKPQTAWRVRWNMNTDTPLPPDESTAPNPPEGAIIDYYLRSAASGPISLEITGSDGRVVRRYSSTDRVFIPDPATITIPLYWFRPLAPLSAAAGMHRYTWDMHYQPLDANALIGGPNLPIAAVKYNTVPAPTTPWVNPGQYTVKLTVNGGSYSQPLVVKQDPRVKTPALLLQQIYTLSKAAYYSAVDARTAAQQAITLRDQISKLRPGASGALAQSLAALEAKLDALVPPSTAANPGDPTDTASRPQNNVNPATLAGAGAALARVMNLLQDADVPPTTLKLNAIATARASAARTLAKWSAIKTVDVPALNTKLAAAGMPTITP
jgi:hypothetical protein